MSASNNFIFLHVSIFKQLLVVSVPSSGLGNFCVTVGHYLNQVFYGVLREFFSFLNKKFFELVNGF